MTPDRRVVHGGSRGSETRCGLRTGFRHDLPVDYWDGHTGFRTRLPARQSRA